MQATHFDRLRRPHLEHLVLKGHVRLRLKTNTGTEDVGQGSALLRQCVDDRSAWRGQGSLEKLAGFFRKIKHGSITFNM